MSVSNWIEGACDTCDFNVMVARDSFEKERDTLDFLLNMKTVMINQVDQGWSRTNIDLLQQCLTRHEAQRVVYEEARREYVQALSTGCSPSHHQ